MADHPSFLDLLKPQPDQVPSAYTEAHTLTVEDLRAAIDTLHEREAKAARLENAQYLAFVESLPEGIMDSTVLTHKEVSELRTIAMIVGRSVSDPLNPRDAQKLRERVGVLVAKHKRWSP